MTALGCHTTNRAGLASPAAAKYVSQSSPGALVPKSALDQWLFPLLTLPDASRLQCACAMRVSSWMIEAALASAPGMSASLSMAATCSWYLLRIEAMADDESR